MSNRVALAPITDSRLNTGSNSGTPLKKKKRSPPPETRFSPTSISSGPLSTGIKRPSLIYSKSFLVRHLASTPSKKKSLSFSDYRTTVLPHHKRLNKIVKNNKAGLAATKLKLKLQLALYKLQQTRGLQTVKSIEIPSTSKTCTETVDTKEKMHSMSESKQNGFKQPNKETSMRSFGSLSKIACQKSKLRLFQVKKDSVYWQKKPEAVPLTKEERFEPTFSTRFILPSVALSAEARPSLPSINKILKTPIKNANSTRSLITHSHDDTTIDEDGDATIINTTQKHPLHDDEEYQQALERKCKDILSSSPLQNHFGTPNSFSVAKLLLQLGSYGM